MDFNRSNGGGGGSAPATAKFLIAGGFGVGKTTFVGAISEIRPLRTEEPLSVASVGIDDTRAVGGKTTTTVAMDFGRISVHSGLVLYLFGTPGQERFWFMWDELAVGALGAVILADTRRVGDCFASIDYFERNGTPFVIAVNCFDGAPRFQPEDIRIALSLGPEVPILLCDARQRDSVKQVLVNLVKHVMAVTGPALSGGLRLSAARRMDLRGEDGVTACARGLGRYVRPPTDQPRGQAHGRTHPDANMLLCAPRLTCLPR